MPELLNPLRRTPRWIDTVASPDMRVIRDSTESTISVARATDNSLAGLEDFWRPQSIHTTARDSLPIHDQGVSVGPQAFVLFGERFFFEVEDGTTFLVHPHWSLVGEGESPAHAVVSLIGEAVELAGEMRDNDAESLSASALALRDFVMRIAP